MVMKKTDYMYFSAVLCVVASVLIAFLAFDTSHVIDESVLVYIAQCLLFAASIFGVDLVVSSRLKKWLK